MSHKLLSKKALLIVTGASRGIGKQVAVSFAPLLEKGSHVILLARCLNSLKQTAEILPSHVTVHYTSIDLGATSASELKDYILQSVENNLERFESLILVHNVGSIGDVSKKTNDAIDFDVWRKYYDLNLFSVAVLNGVVIKLFEDKKDVKKLVINISSLAAIEPFKSMSYYSSVKAARDMFFKVFALENLDVDVLNYSPGPVQTDMLDTLMANAIDKDIKQQFSNLKSERKILSPEKTIKRLLEVLEKHEYKSGEHVDYYSAL